MWPCSIMDQRPWRFLTKFGGIQTVEIQGWLLLTEDSDSSELINNLVA
ncbi:hypothetical protein BDK88_2159 [Natrinema hispanicum]|uniref:Uncharacterized protein n=1 Tax=Natrinema hispanicum TaxID=392421 RepID=A0A482YB49_9EURY|nr:hypothetical protein BDK88_2159 [Natrinema hispanicum]